MAARAGAADRIDYRWIPVALAEAIRCDREMNRGALPRGLDFSVQRERESLCLYIYMCVCV